MRLAEFSVKHYQFTIVAFLLMVALGVSSLLTMPRSEDPSFPNANFIVVAIFPGAGPKTVEELVIDPLEDALSEVDEVRRLTSSAEDGLGVVFVEGNASADADAKYEEVLREVNAVRPKLPDTLLGLTVERWSTTNVAILQVALVSPDLPYAALEEITERFERRLEAVPGVKKVRSWGIPEREVRVTVDKARLAGLNLPVERVLAAIGADNVTIPGGQIEAGGRSFNVKTSGGYASLDELRGTIVGAGPGGLVRLSDIAAVEWDHADETHLTRLNGARSVFLTVEQKEGQNIFEVRADALREIERFRATLPAGARLVAGFDQSQNVGRRLGALAWDFAFAVLLVLVTLLPLGLRASVIVMISIPLSLAIGLALLNASGHTINQISIVGFVIALGLLVDDSIVVTENVTRFLRQGVPRRQAAIEATRQIGLAVLGCTATLIFAFLPLLFLPGDPGKFIRSLPLSVIFTVLASLLVSLSIIPFLASLLLKETSRENLAYRLFRHGIERSYRPVLHLALARPRVTLLLTVLVLAGSLALVPRIGFSLFPKAGIPQFLVQVETPKGASLGETDRAVRFAEGVLGRQPEVKTVFANTGRGNPQVYYNAIPRREQSNVGELFVVLHRYDKSAPAFFDRLRGEMERYPGARIEVQEFENGPPVDAPIAIRIFAESLDTLEKLAGEVEAIIAAVPGTAYLDNPLERERTDLKILVDPATAAMYGVVVAEAERTIRMAIAGLPAGQLRTPEGKEYDIVVSAPRGARPSLASLEGLSVAARTGEQVPLRQISRMDFESSPSLIEHHNRERVAMVSAFVRTGYNTDRVTKQILERLDRKAWPQGTRYQPAGEIESRRESFGGLGSAVLVAAFGILAILVLEFGTFKSTLIVASVIPLGVIGGLIGLFATGYTLSFTAAVGFVALIGIEVKNSILLVDFTNRLRERGVALDLAIEQAGEIRFFPVLLTTLTAIGGLLPLALSGSSLYSPLAVVIIGGLLSSTLLARLVTPVMYKLIPPRVQVATNGE